MTSQQAKQCLQDGGKRLEPAETGDWVPSGESWEGRSFDQSAWLLRVQDSLTPAGLAFGQAEWDQTVKETIHTRLESTEPVYLVFRMRPQK